MRVLVTGGTGLIGRRLVPLLLERGHEVWLLVRPETRRGMTEGPARLLEGDLTVPGLGVEGPLPSFDHVFHLAGAYDLTLDEATLHRVNVDGTRNLLERLAAERFGGVLHHVSSVAVAGRHRGPVDEAWFETVRHPHAYHASKHASEALVRESSLRKRIYRPSAVVGDALTGVSERHDGGYHVFSAVKRARHALPGWATVPAPFDTPLNMIPADLCAQAIDALAHAEGLDGRTFHLVDPDPPSFSATWNLLAEAAGAPKMRPSRLARGLDRFVPGVGGLIGSSPSVRALREQLGERLGIPAIFLRAHNREATFPADATWALLEGLGLRFPDRRAWLTALWDHWQRHLDPDREPQDRVRRAFAGRLVVVTGASSGVGEALADRLGAAGARLVLVARREAELTAVAERIRAVGGEAVAMVADLSDLEACDALVARVLDEQGVPDVLVNNAARSIRRPAVESIERFHDFERVMQLNYFAPIRLVRGFLPGMRARRSGRVVNVLTAGVALTTPGFSAYASSKAALSHLTDTLSAELLHEGIRFSGVHLPWVRTAMMGERFSETRAIGPAEAAEWILEAVVEDRQHVKDASTTRRWVATALAPGLVTGIASVLVRIYGDPEEHAAFQGDRAMIGRLFPGNLL